MKIPIIGSGQCWKLGLVSYCVIGALVSSSKNFAYAQITPDDTLGDKSSLITPLDPLVDQINGGTIRGENLFHSFQEFNVSEGRGAYFISRNGIKNILSRVTGNNASNIFGKIGVLEGNANLFLINPNGIVFGRNASLDVRGSFVATTANAIQFGNEGFFSASGSNVPPVLTVNPSALLFNQIVAGPITNGSREPAGQRSDPSELSGIRNLFGLRVPDGRSLLIVGGNVTLNGGGLNALDGRVELGAVAGLATVGLDVSSNNIRLNFPNDVAKSDLFFSNGARVDTSGEGGGSIQVQGRHVTLNQGSQITATTLGSKPGENLVVSASDSVNLIGFTRGGILATRTWGAGKAGDLRINTRKLIVQDGAQVLTSTNSTNDKGSGGDLTVSASESVELSGTTSDRFKVPSGLLSSTVAAGDAGDLTINTRSLLIRSGARLSTESTGTTSSRKFIPATGRGGKLTVNDAESVELIGGFVLTGTQGMGTAGDIELNTRRLTVKEGAQVSASTLGGGLGGQLTVNASDSVKLIGSSTLVAITQGTGDAGNLKIATGNLLVKDHAEVAVSSEGKGNAGDMEVIAHSVRLEDGAKLTGDTISGERGNIRLQDLNSLLLSNGSKISTSASGTGNGGNITIDTDTLVALNSDIIANAVSGLGGKVEITAQGIFGPMLRCSGRTCTPVNRVPTQESDITAVSQQGGPQLDGLVEINRLEIDPSRGLVTLPVELVDVSGLIAQGCSVGEATVARGSSEFIVTGHGGLPPTPTEALRSDSALTDLGTPVYSEENRASAATSSKQTSSEPALIVEAQGWVIGSKGEVMLTAQAPTVTFRIPWLPPTTCNAP